MPFTIQYGPENCYVIGTLSGEVDRSILRQYTIEMNDLMRENPCNLILSDYRDCTFTFSVYALFELPDKHNHLLAALGQNVFALKRALLVSNEYLDQFIFFENVAVNRGQRVKVFTEETEAVAWLLE
jgi:hypothetical protein